MDNKTIAKYALGFIGGKPVVDRFYDENETKSIDVMTCTYGYCGVGKTVATVGLNHTDVGITAGGRSLRVELMMSGLEDGDVMGNIISTMAFEIMDSKTCKYGMIFSNVIGMYINDATVKNIVLMSPVFWDSYKNFEIDDLNVAWLLAVPVSDSEKEYIEKSGIDAFDVLLEKKQVDVFDMYRDSVI